MFSTVKDAHTENGKLETQKDRMMNEGGHTETKDSVRKFRVDARQAANAVKEDIEDVKEHLEDVARRTGHHARELVDSAEGNLEEISETLTGYVRKKPITSVAIAAGVGVVLSMFFRRH